MRDIFFGNPAKATRKGLALIVALGTEEYPDRRVAAEQWFDHLKSRPTPWLVTRLDVAGGTHSADSGNAYRMAMRRLFPGR